MKIVSSILENRIAEAMAAVTGRADCAAMVTAATDAKFGDYQANGVMPLAKQLKTNPRKLAEQIVAKLDLTGICEKPEIAGPGFINLRLKPGFIAKALLEINADPTNRLGIEKLDKTQTIVVDFSGPNIAKQMHVGHLRSTIIGDCVCRMLDFLGHDVIRQNHIGDWGLQMGMVAEALIEKEYKDFLHHNNIRSTIDIYTDLVRRSGNYPEFQRNFLERQNIAISSNLEDLERHYKDISSREKTDNELARRVRGRTKDLQEGDSFTLYFWEQSRTITLDACFVIYEQLGIVPFKEEDIRGESFYKDMLPEAIKELKKLPETKESNDATCVFPEGFKNKEGEPLPFIIQKSDGAYLYATTDLAALRYRVGELKADKIIYVTDARQKLHFQMLFATGRAADWVKDAELAHVTFGTVLGENGQPLKTREGENVKLKELLDEAVERAKAVVEEKNPDLPQDKKDEIAKAVGIGAVKYADYSNNRESDYVFSFDKMLAMDGNTAPYMQYAYARIKSIERKAVGRDVDIEKELAGIKSLDLTDPAELELAKHILRYGEAIQSAAADSRPNYLTSYLYELAQKFSIFYTNCPVLKADPDKRPTRLLLCNLTERTIKNGLADLLGIEVVEQM